MSVELSNTALRLLARISNRLESRYDFRRLSPDEDRGSGPRTNQLFLHLEQIHRIHQVREPSVPVVARIELGSLLGDIAANRPKLRPSGVVRAGINCVAEQVGQVTLVTFQIGGRLGR